MSKWIHVTERKPETLDTDWACNGPLWGYSMRWGVNPVQYEVSQGQRGSQEEKWQAYETTGDGTGLDAEYYDDITHWMEWETPAMPEGAAVMKPRAGA